MDDVALAVVKGYIFLEIYDIYEYQVTRYDTKMREGGMFADYIVTILKLS